MMQLHGGPAGPDFCITMPAELPPNFPADSIRLFIAVTMSPFEAGNLLLDLNRLLFLDRCKTIRARDFLSIAHSVVYEYHTTTEDGVHHFVYDRLEQV